MDINLINIIIYVCASLGGVLLLLCIILASFFLYNVCVKYFGIGIIGRQQACSCPLIQFLERYFGMTIYHNF